MGDESRRTRRHGALILLGTVCVGIGAVGVVVPGLPTTVFLLAASYLFARSCPELNRRLLEHPRLGPYLRMAETRTMPRRAKLMAILMMWSGILLAWLTIPDSLHIVRVLLVMLGATGTLVVAFHVRTMRSRASRQVGLQATESE